MVNHYDFGFVFDQFNSFSSLHRTFLSYFMTLIHKVVSSSQLRDFWQFYLMMSLYNLVSKMLVNRLSQAIENHISHNESTFLRADCYLMGDSYKWASGFWKKNIKVCLIFKVDLDYFFCMIQLFDALWIMNYMLVSFRQWSDSRN